MKFMGTGAGKIWKLKNNQENFQKTLDIPQIGGIMSIENQKEVIWEFGKNTWTTWCSGKKKRLTTKKSVV